jgi:hypothetical protein
VAGTLCSSGRVENVGTETVLLVIAPCKLMRCLPNLRRQVLSLLSRWQLVQVDDRKIRGGGGVSCCLVGMGPVDKFEDCFDLRLSP